MSTLGAAARSAAPSGVLAPPLRLLRAAAILLLLLTFAALTIAREPAREHRDASRPDPYAVRAIGERLVASNPSAGLKATFDPTGIAVQSAGTSVRLSLRAAGFGSSLVPVRRVSPSAVGARVVYERGGITEWYANTRRGLEQGFTVARPAAAGSAQPLTLSIELGGNVRPSVIAGGQGLALRRPGTNGLVYTGLSAVDARGRALHSRLTLSGGRLLVRVRASGAAYPVTIDPFLQQGPKLTGPSSGVDFFGSSVALSADGGTALIGAHLEGDGAGGAWIFTRSDSSWTQQGPKLTVPGGGQFGASVDLSADGGTALVGARRSAGGGAVYVFTRPGSTWAQQGEAITPAELESEDAFGGSVALSGDGDTALVGGEGHDGERGAAWVFVRGEGSWQQQGSTIEAAEGAAEDNFGHSVALSADGATAVIGAPGADGRTGAGWAFSRTGSTWAPLGGKLTGTGVPDSGRFAYRVALSGDGSTALFGENSSTGAAWAFSRGGEGFSQQGEPFTDSEEGGEGNFFGSGGLAVSADGDAALIAAPNLLAAGGAAWKFTRSGSTWEQQSDAIVGGEEVAPSRFGDSIALSADARTAIVGGFDNHGVGAAWVFVSEPSPPIVVPRGASGLTQTSATLSATVNPEGTTVGDCHLEYGTSTFYGMSLPCVPSPGSGISAIAVSARADGLTPGTTYHFRAVATNTIGTSFGGDRSFTTLAIPPAPTIRKLAPKKGPAAGGTSVTITGTALGGASAVRFGGVAATSFVVSSATSITATAPPAQSGSVDVTVSTAGGTSAISSKDRFTYEAPRVTGLSPNTGPTAGGTTVTVTGSGFATGPGTTALKFGKALGTSVSCSSSAVCTVVAPAGKAGAVDVTAIVGTAKGKKNPPADRFVYG